MSGEHTVFEVDMSIMAVSDLAVSADSLERLLIRFDGRTWASGVPATPQGL